MQNYKKGLSLIFLILLFFVNFNLLKAESRFYNLYSRGYSNIDYQGGPYPYSRYYRNKDLPKNLRDKYYGKGTYYAGPAPWGIYPDY